MADESTDVSAARGDQLPRRDAVAAPPPTQRVQFVPFDQTADSVAASQRPGSRQRPGVPRGRRMRPTAPVAEPVDHVEEQHSYWSTDALFAESRRVEDLVEHRTDAELLVELELEPRASSTDIARAQRRLALAHHPDRWATHATAIREHHEDRMRRVNQVVAELRKRDLA